MEIGTAHSQLVLVFSHANMHVAKLSSSWQLKGPCHRIKIFHTGRPKKNYYFTFCLIFQEPNNKITNRFFLLKTEIHTHILNTKPFLYDSRGLRCLRYKMGFLTHKFINKMTHNGPNSLKVTSSCPDQPLTDTAWPWQSPSDPMKH